MRRSRRPCHPAGSCSRERGLSGPRRSRWLRRRRRGRRRRRAASIAWRLCLMAHENRSVSSRGRPGAGDTPSPCRSRPIVAAPERWPRSAHPARTAVATAMSGSVEEEPWRAYCLYSVSDCPASSEARPPPIAPRLPPGLPGWNLRLANNLPPMGGPSVPTTSNSRPTWRGPSSVSVNLGDYIPLVKTFHKLTLMFFALLIVPKTWRNREHLRCYGRKRAGAVL